MGKDPCISSLPLPAHSRIQNSVVIQQQFLTSVEFCGKKSASLPSRLIREDSSNACVSTTEAAIEPKKTRDHAEPDPIAKYGVRGLPFTMPSAVTKRFDGKRPSCETHEPFHSLHPCFGCHGRHQACCRGSDENDPCPSRTLRTTRNPGPTFELGIARWQE
jgi:hypothetical protein